MSSQPNTATQTAIASAASGIARPLDSRYRALKQLPLFANCQDGDIDALRNLIRLEIVPQGKLIVELEGTDTHLFIIAGGRAVVRRVNPRGTEYVDRQAQPGQVLNEFPFLTGLHSQESAEALEEVRLWSIDKAEFDKLLAKRPAMRSRLQIPPRTADILARMRKRDWLKPNETVLLDKKRHAWFFLRLLIPVLLVAALAIALAWLLIPAALGIAVGVVFVIAGGFLSLQYIDWRNDFYAVTDQRVVHREQVLMLRDEQNEIPLNKIQDVTVQRFSRNPIENTMLLILDIGDVVIQAQGTNTSVVFRQIGKPDAVTEEIFAQRDRARGESRVAWRSKMRAEIRRNIGLVGPAPSAGAKAPRLTPLQKRWEASKKSFRQNMRSLLPDARLVQGDQITYRKHWLFLARRIWLQALLVVLVLGIIALLVPSSPMLSQIMTESWVGPALYIVIFVMLGGWLLWRYEDWRNDVYILTKDRLIDVVKSPFGLRGQQRREASLTAVQNVTASTHGFINSLFNVGDVIIRTGGADGVLNFIQVYNPRRIQKDIQTRQQEAEAGKTEREAATRRAELAEGIGIYDELTRLHDRQKFFSPPANPPATLP